MGNADGLSRLPLPKSTGISHDFINFNSIVGELPIEQENIAEATRVDETLEKVLGFVETNSWPKRNDNADIRVLVRRQDEVSVVNGCIMLGNRIIIPRKLRRAMLNLLHNQHIGIVRMKATARGAM